MQTAARLDFIGLPRLRRCGGSVFLCWKENWGAAVDCGGEGWIVGARVGLGARLDFGGEVRLGARLWIVGARLDLVRGWIVSAQVGLGARRGLWWRGWAWCAAVNCVGEVGLGARRGLCRRGWAWSEAWIVSARLGLERGVDCVGEVGLGARRYRNCVKRRCGKKVRKVANL